MPRQPSAKAHEDVLAVTWKLIASRGIDRLSVDAIAEASGVSKATIYKHWPNKEALCLEAIGRLQSKLPPGSATESPRNEMIRLLEHLGDTTRPSPLTRIMPKILGYASTNPQFLKAWADRIEEPRRARVAQLIERAVAAGELRPDVDLAVAVHALLGPVLYARMMRTTVTAKMAERIVDMFWKAHAPDVKKTPKR